jgi:hypothetical protein
MASEGAQTTITTTTQKWLLCPQQITYGLIIYMPQHPVPSDEMSGNIFVGEPMQR